MSQSDNEANAEDYKHVQQKILSRTKTRTRSFSKDDVENRLGFWLPLNAVSTYRLMREATSLLDYFSQFFVVLDMVFAMDGIYLVIPKQTQVQQELNHYTRMRIAILHDRVFKEAYYVDLGTLTVNEFLFT